MGLFRTSDGRHNAPFKLLADFHNFTRGKIAGSALGVMWTTKKFCASCDGAVSQMKKLMPQLQIQFAVAEPGQIAESRQIIKDLLQRGKNRSGLHEQKTRELPE